MSTFTRPIFVLISLPSTLQHIGDGSLNEDDLARAVFAFEGCFRTEVMDQYPDIWRHASLAEGERRAAWQRNHDHCLTSKQLAICEALQGASLKGFEIPSHPVAMSAAELKHAIEAANNHDGTIRAVAIA